MNNGNEAAFAAPEAGTENFSTSAFQKGLTKREYFAGQIMAALVTKESWMTPAEFVAKRALVLTDALLNELQKQ